MRRFTNVLETSVCTTCGVIVQPSPAEGYSRQTIISFDGSTISGIYCSNRCVNEGNARLEEMLEAEKVEMQSRGLTDRDGWFTTRDGNQAGLSQARHGYDWFVSEYHQDGSSLDMFMKDGEFGTRIWPA